MISGGTQGESKPGHTSPGWKENHLVEAALEEAMVEAMAKGDAGNHSVGTTRMNNPTKQPFQAQDKAKRCHI